MKLDCEIVRDLLPSYLENLVSAKTRQAVEEHLAACAACRGCCDALRAPEPEPPDAAEEAAVQYLKKLRKERRKTWGLVGLALVLALLCIGGILAASVAYNRGVYRSRSPLVSPENTACAALGALPDGRLAFCIDAKIQWDHRLPYLELEDGGLQVGLTRSQEEDQQTEEAYRYWLVVDLPALERMGIDSKEIGYKGAADAWWQRGQTVEPLNEGLATVLADALEGGEAFALSDGAQPVLTVLTNVSPRAAARDNAEHFLRTLYTSGWYTENDEITRALLPQLLGAWCSADGASQAATNCLLRNLFGRPLENVSYAVESVMLTPGSEDVYDYTLQLRVSGKNAKFQQAEVKGSVQIDEFGRVDYFRHQFFEAGGYQCPGDLFLEETAWSESGPPVKKVA